MTHQEIVDDDSDEDFEAMSLDDEDDDDVIAVDDDDSEDLEEPKPKPAKRAKTTPAPAAAAGKGKGKAGSTPAKGRGKAANRPAMVIEKDSQESAGKKRKLPGSMVRQEPGVGVGGVGGGPGVRGCFEAVDIERTCGRDYCCGCACEEPRPNTSVRYVTLVPLKSSHFDFVSLMYGPCYCFVFLCIIPVHNLSTSTRSVCTNSMYGSHPPAWV
jgi:hypothetical protein